MKEKDQNRNKIKKYIKLKAWEFKQHKRARKLIDSFNRCKCTSMYVCICVRLLFRLLFDYDLKSPENKAHLNEVIRSSF